MRDVLIDGALLMLVVSLSTLLMTGLLVVIAPKIGLVDRPNARSSHVVPTPRAGGAGIVLAIVVCAIWWVPITADERLAMVPAAIVLAVLGLVDDFRGLSPWLRLSVHFVCAGWAVYLIGDLPPLGLAWLDATEWIRSLVLVFALVWFLNAFNFMDGIDGIAASQGVFVAVAASVCSLVLVMDPGVTQLSAAVAGACLGFLLLNWSPAKIFMGDVGSGTLGFLLGILGLIAWRRGVVSPWAFATLVTAFIADASVTLVRRMLAGDQWHVAHRTHAYQHLARRLSSHSTATLLFLCWNLFLLGPIAVAIQVGALELHPGLAWALAFALTCWLATWLGAGRRDTSLDG